jgi:hypothetical protein
MKYKDSNRYRGCLEHYMTEKNGEARKVGEREGWKGVGGRWRPD